MKHELPISLPPELSEVTQTIPQESFPQSQREYKQVDFTPQIPIPQEWYDERWDRPHKRRRIIQLILFIGFVMVATALAITLQR